MQDRKFRILKRDRPPYLQYGLVSLGIVFLVFTMLAANLNNEIQNKNQLNTVYARMIEGSITRTLESVENSLFPLLMELNEIETTPSDLENLKKRISNQIFFAPHIRQIVVLKNEQPIFDSNHLSKGEVDLSKLNFPQQEVSHYSVNLRIGNRVKGRFLPIKGETVSPHNNRNLIPIHLQRQFIDRVGQYSILVAVNASHIERIFKRLDVGNLDEHHLMRLDGHHLLQQDHLSRYDHIHAALSKLVDDGRDETTIEIKKHGFLTYHAAMRLSPKYPMAIVVSADHIHTARIWVQNNKHLILALGLATVAILVFVFFLYLDFHRNRRLRKEVQLLSTAVHQSPVTILITDRDGIIQYANTAFETVFGYKEKDWAGRTPGMLKSGHSNDEVYKDLWDTIRQGQPWQGEFLNKTKSNDLIPTTSAISPVIDEDGNFTHIVGILADISTQKALQEKAQEASRLAKKANEAKSNFLATMSHELRTPMTGIRGIISLLRSQDISSEEAQMFLKDLDQSSNALMFLLNDILDLSKIEAGKLQIEHIACNPAEIITTILHLFQDNADHKSIAITTNAENYKNIWIKTDSLRLHQIISNLLSNSIKFTQQGQIDVHMNVRELYDDQLELEISVHDTGIGMSEDQLDKIFAPFTQADSSTTRKYGGTGLGLTITKQLCELLEGHIRVVSKVGKGTSFIVTLKVEKTSPPEDNTLEKVNFSSLNILLAEDNPINIKVISTILKRKGHKVTCAPNGKVAVSQAAQQPFDVILMDMHMPEMDGMDATRIIRESSPVNQNTPILALTADAFPEHHLKYKECGINDIITKPVKWDQLEQSIARHLK
ncbi:MAG: response regulator [Methylocystaceae bacterium]|nr:response regulator [Methylocystaceae bacterium]